MAQSAYLNAIEEAEQELDKLQKENAPILKKIEALKTFIRTGQELLEADS